MVLCIVGDLSANALAIYLIIWKSGKTIGPYKWLLLNIVIAALVFDLYMTLFFMPFPLLPVVGLCTEGLLGMFGTGMLWGRAVPFLLMIQLLGPCAGAIIYAGLYRLAAVFGRHELLLAKPVVVFMVVVGFLYPLPTISMAYFGAIEVVNEQKEIAAKALKDYPGVSQLYFSDPCIIVSTASMPYWMKVASYSGVVQMLIGMSFPVGIFIASMVTLRRRRRIMSRKTFDMHKQLTLALALQAVIPFTSLFLPFFFLGLSLSGVVTLDKGSVQLLTQCAVSHSLLNVFILIFCTKPYRNAVLLPFTKILDRLRLQPTRVFELQTIQGASQLSLASPATWK